MVELLPTSQKGFIWWVEVKQSSFFEVELCTTTPILVGLSQTIKKIGRANSNFTKRVIRIYSNIQEYGRVMSNIAE